MLNWFAAKYGATVLAAPIRGGFDNVAWIAPIGGVYAGDVWDGASGEGLEAADGQAAAGRQRGGMERSGLARGGTGAICGSGSGGRRSTDGHRLPRLF